MLKLILNKLKLISLAFLLSLSFANAQYSLISSPKERQLGNQILFEISRYTPIYDDLLWNDYLEELTNFLISFSSNPTTHIKTYITKNNEINAFALPGNIIVINSGLILTSQNEGQLAAVLAHEIAHVTQRHYQRMYQAYTDEMFLSTASLLASILIGGAISPEIAQASALSSVAASREKLIGYTRAHEYEADRIAQKMLKNTGFNKKAMSDFLANLPNNNYHQALEPLLTHPTVTKRQAETINLDKIKGKDYIIISAINYQLLKIQLGVNTNSKVSEKGLNRIETNYQKGLILLKNQKYNKASSVLMSAFKASDENLTIGLAYLQALIKTKNNQSFFQIYNQLANKNPQSLALKIIKSDYLINTNQLEKARWYLYELLNDHQYQYRIYQKLAFVYDQLNNKGLMHFYLADFYYYQGHFAYALSQLKLAQSSLEKGSRYYREVKVKEEKLKRLLLQ